MANLVEAIKKVALAVLVPKEDGTSYTQVSDFKNIDAKKTNLSPKAMEELLAGSNEADAFEKTFGQVSAKKSQPVVQPNNRAARTAQSPILSQYRTARSPRTSIVEGETIKPEEDDKEHERTYGPKY